MLISATSSSPLLVLAVLACPVGMILMMVFMGRGMRGGAKESDGRDTAADAHSLAEMKAEQARLAEKIEVLEDRHSHANESKPVADREADRVG